MKLSIIIVNYNVKHYLEQCLDSVLLACQGIDAEVIVVDNQSSDGSQEMLKEKFPNLKCIFNEKNVGFSKANNQAIKMAKGEYILLLNPDTLVETQTFAKSIEFMDAHPEAGSLGVKMINGNGDFLPESKRGFPTPAVAFYRFSGLSKLFPKSKRFNKYHLGHLNENKTHEIEVLAGAYMFLRKSVLDQIGLLDESFFMYGEDIDLSYRITQAGYKNYYLPETRIIHYKGESTKKSSVNYVLVFYKAMMIFTRKHFSAKRYHLLFYLIFIAIYIKTLFSLVFRFQAFKQPSSFIKKRKQIMIVGSKEECENIESLIRDYKIEQKYIGHITFDKSIKRHPGFIGSFAQLKDISKIYQIDEVIFSSNHLKIEDILDKIEELENSSITYKFIRGTSPAILGSNSSYVA